MGTPNRRDQPDFGSLTARWRRFTAGLRALRHRDAAGAELDEELRAYLDAAAADALRRQPNLSPAEARRQARAAMGSLESVKQEVRASFWESAVDSFWQDLRYAVRQLTHNPAFAAVAILTLALGIGANTAIFTLVHGVMWKTLPVPDPASLYRIGEGEQFCCQWGGLQDSWGTFDYPFFRHLQTTEPAFAHLAAFSGNTPAFSVGHAGAAQSVDGEFVSGSFFPALGIRPVAGRLLDAADDQPGAPAALVIGHDLWQRQFAANPAIAGTRVIVNGLPFTIAGVAPQGFHGARLTSEPPELWIPLNQSPAFGTPGRKSELELSGMAWLYVFGRLRPDAPPPAELQSPLTASLQHWLRAEGRRDDERHQIAAQHIRLTPGATGVSGFRSDSKTGLQLLTVAALLVLLIACANLANLLLARGTARRRQTALRLSLGASHARLIRAALTESLLLALLGGAAGLLLAHAAASAILLIAFRGATHIPIDPAPSLPVFAFTLAVSTLTAILFGAAPAWMGARAEGHRVTARTSLTQRLMIVLQAALSVILLAAAGMITQSLKNLETSDLGFAPEGRLIANLNLRAAGYTPAQLPALYDEIRQRLEAIPGARRASLSLNSPQNLCCINLNIGIAGRPDPWIGKVNVLYQRVTPNYFETLGTPILRGRAITPEDTATSRRVAVIDEAFANKFFQGQDPLGRHFGLSLPGHENDFEIVGVVRDAKYRSPAAVQNPVFFLPFTQTTAYAPAGYQSLETGTLYAQTIELSVSAAPESYERPLRETLASINSNLIPNRIQTYTEHVAVQYNHERLLARLTGLFSLLALVLASVGLYSVTAYAVTRRRAEIGIRMALGASRAAVVAMVLRGALGLVGIGLAAGLPLAILTGHYLSSQLYGVGKFHPAALGGAVLALLLCALAAGLAPARHAASIPPADALRVE